MMDEYKMDEDCISHKEKNDVLIRPIDTTSSLNLYQDINIFIKQFSNFSSQPISNLSNPFQYACNFIKEFQDKNLLIQSLSNSPLCLDCIHYFQIICQNQDDQLTIPDSYLDLVFQITFISSLFSDNPDYASFICMMIDNFERFPQNQQIIINNIINYIIFSCENKEFLYELYKSPQHPKLLNFALQIKDIRDENLTIMKGAQLIIKNFYKNLTLSFNDENFAMEILSGFYDILDQYHLYDETCNEYFIIDLSIQIIFSFPQTYKVVYENHESYFHSLFNYLRYDSKLAFFAFKLITMIIQNLPFENPPDLDDYLNWEFLLNFFKYPDDGKLKMMLCFSAAYLKFGSAFFHKFSEKGFFDLLLEKMLSNSFAFSTNKIATNCLINAITFSAASQVFELFKKGVLSALLSVLENDSDPDLTSGILDSIRRIWEVCENTNEKSSDGFSATDNFTICFSNECGYQILSNLSTCHEKAQILNNMISDPPNMYM